MKSILIFIAALWTTVSLAMEIPTLHRVFNQDIYQIVADTNTPAESILEQFRNGKRNQLTTVIVADLERQIDSLESQHQQFLKKNRIIGFSTLLAAIPTAYFAPSRVGSVVTGGFLANLIFGGADVDIKFLNELKHRVASYLAAIQGEAIARIEEEYIVAKYHQPIEPKLANRIEIILIESREPVANSFSAEEFVRGALNLPHTHKQFTDVIKFAKSDDIDDGSRKKLNGFMASVCRQSKLTGSDLNLRSCLMIFDDQSASSDMFAKRVGNALGLPCLSLDFTNPKDSLFDTCVSVENPQKGALFSALSSAPNLESNALVLIDLNRLAEKTDHPLVFIKDLVSDRKRASRYFGSDVDLSRLNFVVHFHEITDNIHDAVRELANSWDIVEMADFTPETKINMLTRYSDAHELFTQEDRDRAITAMQSIIPAKNIARLFSLLERLSNTVENDWSEVLGVSVSIDDLKHVHSEIASRNEELKNVIVEKEECLESLQQLLDEAETLLAEINRVISPLKKIFAHNLFYIVSEISDNSMMLTNGTQLVLYTTKSGERTSLSTMRKAEFACWKAHDVIELTNAAHGCNAVNYTTKTNLPFARKDRSSHNLDHGERITSIHGAVITTKSQYFERSFDVSYWDTDYIKQWKPGDLVLVGHNADPLAWLYTSKTWVLMNMSQPDSSSYVRVNLRP